MILKKKSQKKKHFYFGDKTDDGWFEVTVGD
jgi:hypothetical protein